MIDLFKSYGIDISKILKKNENIYVYGDIDVIKDVLDYLVNTCKVDPKNIEKSSSILTFNPQNIRPNYEFLIATQIDKASMHSTLNILSTNPARLKETFKYLLEKYGIDYINKSTSILSTDVDRIQSIERLIPDNNLLLSASISKLSVPEINDNINLCRKYNIELTSDIFRKRSYIIKEYIALSRKLNVPFFSKMLRRSLSEVKEIVEYLIANNLEIKGSYFLKEPWEVKEIFRICKEKNIPVLINMFRRTFDEVKTILELSSKYGKSINNFCFLQRPEVIEALYQNLAPGENITFSLEKTKTASEIADIKKLCEQYGLTSKGNIFRKSPQETENIIKYCLQKGVTINKTIFYRTYKEVVTIIDIFAKYGLNIETNAFRRLPEEVDSIISYAILKNIPITGSLFTKSFEETKKIIDLCLAKNIPILPSIFTSSYEKLLASITFVEESYGSNYLTSLIINKDVTYLKEVLPFLDSHHLLPYLINSASILTLKLDEIRSRIKYLEERKEPLVLDNGRFNPIFGISRKNYQKLTKMCYNLDGGKIL